MAKRKLIKKINKKVVIFGSLGVVSMISTIVGVTLAVRKNKNNSKIKTANASISKVAALFDELKNREEGTTSILSNRETISPSSLTSATTAKDLGFEDPSIDKLDGTKVTFAVKSNSVNNVEGKLVVEVTISKKPGNTKKVEFTLVGYQKTIQAHMIDDKAIALKVIEALTTSDFSSIYTPNDKSRKSSNASNKSIAKKTSIVNIIKNKISRTSAKVLIAKNLITLIDRDGTLTIKIALSSFGKTGTKDIVITGFKTNAQAREEQANADKEYNEKTINDWNSLAVIGKSKILPSNVEITNLKTLQTATGLTIPALKGGATLEITATPNDDNGQIKLSIVIVTPNATQTKSVAISKTLTGFQIKADALVEEIRKIVNSNSGNVENSKKNETSYWARIENSQHFKDYSGLDLTNIDNIDDAKFTSRANGKSLEVTITVEGSTSNGKIRYTINGFRTAGNIEIDSSKFRNFDKVITGSPTIAPSKNKLISDISFFTKLNGHGDMPPGTEGVRRWFIISTNINTGIVSVDVGFIDREANATYVTYKIKGFKITNS